MANLGAISTAAQVALGADVSGTLPVANGGTGITAGTSGGVLGYTAAGTLASSAALPANGVVLGGGAGGTPTGTAAGIADQVLRLPGVGGPPAFGAIDLSKANAVTGGLPVANGGTGLASGTSGGVLAYTASGTLASSAALAANGVVIGGGAGAAPSATAAGTANQVFRVPGGGGAPAFGTVDVSAAAAVTGVLDETNGGTGQSTITTGDTLYGSASNVLSKLAVGTTDQVLTVAAGIPSWKIPSLQLLSRQTVSGGPVAAITFTGLAGDSEIGYLIIGRIKNEDATLQTITIEPNGLSTNQRGELLSQDSTTLAGAAATSLIVGHTHAATGGTLQFWCWIYAEKAIRRAMSSHAVRDSGSDLENYTSVGTWDETATQITSLEIQSSVTKIANTSVVELYKVS